MLLGHAGSLGRRGAVPGILRVRWEKQKCAEKCTSYYYYMGAEDQNSFAVRLITVTDNSVIHPGGGKKALIVAGYISSLS